MYYIEKMGIYSQGIYWIGIKANQGADKVEQLAKEDKDGYHTWHLKKYLGSGQVENPEGLTVYARTKYRVEIEACYD